MNRCLIVGLLYSLTIMLSLVHGAEKSSSAKLEAELRKTLDELHQTMIKGNEQDIKTLLDGFLINQQQVRTLFPKDADNIWKLMGPARERLLTNVGSLAADAKKRGKPTRIDLINVRSGKLEHAYQSVLNLMPVDVPVYRIVEHYTKGAGGSSAYVKVGNKWVWFPWLSSVPELLEGKLKPVEK